MLNTLDNKLIAKNILLLYSRMLVLMLVQFYTSRIVLEALGVNDFGIYNVVGGVVSLFGFINGTMSSSTQRFLTFALGKQDLDEVKKVFFTALRVHLIIAIIIVTLCETIGLWLLYNKMTIPEDRISAAFGVFQCSIITACVFTISIPYNALIIAHEKMSAFAYMSIFEVLAKLGIAFLIVSSDFDKLIIYAALIMLMQLMLRFLYTYYCRKNFKETHGQISIDLSMLKEMSIYAGWNLWGTSAFILYTQGLNVILNMFFGPIVNAARGVSVQVQGAVQQFSQNFLMAVNPQITKSYASGNLNAMYDLIFRSSRLTFFLLFIITFPLILETRFILDLWLVDVPNYAIIFLRLCLIIAIVDAISNPLMQAIGATGHIGKYQMVIGGLLILIFPISYLVLKLGGKPFTVYYVHLTIALFAFLFRLIFVNSRLKFGLKRYYKEVILKIALVTLLSCPVPLIFHLYMQVSFLNSLFVILITVLISVINIIAIGLNSAERCFIFDKIKKNQNLK